MLYAIVVWLVADGLKGDTWLQMLCLLVGAVLMQILNNKNALIRITTRMVAATFLVLSCLTPSLFASIQTSIVSLAMLTAYIVLLPCYQHDDAQPLYYNAYLSISLASLVFPQILFFVPFMLLLTATKLKSFSLRSVCAALLGLITPYWFLAVWLFFSESSVSPLLAHFASLGKFQMWTPQLWIDAAEWLLPVAMLVVLFIIGTIHFMRYAYNDKLRTRQFFSFFMMMFVLTLVFLILQPQHAPELIPILVINVSPLVAHFFSLTNTRWTNAAFVLFILLSVAITALRLFHVPLFNFQAL